MNTDLIDIEGGRGRSNPVITVIIILVVLGIIAIIVLLILMGTCIYDPLNLMHCCSKGMKWDDKTEKCIDDGSGKGVYDTTCPQGMKWDSVDKKCKSDGSGIIDTTCANGYKWDNTAQRCAIINTGTPTCPSGMKWDTSLMVCVSSGTGGGSGTPPGVGCIRGTNITTWGRPYDSCDVEKEASDACMFQDQSKYGANPARWAYDALWDSRVARNYDCGPTQSDYKGTTWWNICTKALTELPIGLTYEKVGCNKK